MRPWRQDDVSDHLAVLAFAQRERVRVTQELRIVKPFGGELLRQWRCWVASWLASFCTYLKVGGVSKAVLPCLSNAVKQPLRVVEFPTLDCTNVVNAAWQHVCDWPGYLESERVRGKWLHPNEVEKHGTQRGVMTAVQKLWNLRIVEQCHALALR